MGRLQQTHLYLTVMHPAQCGIDELEAQCRFRFSRTSGPGGQHRNKVETHVTVEHLPTGIRAAAGEARSQGENRQHAMQRLRCALAVGVRYPHPDSQPGPSLVWQRYRRGSRLRVAATNPDFPAMLAEALDTLAANDWDPGRSGQALGVSATQIVGLAAQYPPALELLNQQLVARGRSPRTSPSS